jgi:hypothetical protein
MQTNFLRLSVAAFITLLVFSACQKERSFQNDADQQPGTGGPSGPGSGTGTAAAIKGDWKFINNVVKTHVTVEVNDAGQNMKSTTESNYTTENNGGTLTITDNQFLFKGITYAANSTAHSKTWLNGLLVNEIDLPFNAATPPTDYTFDYVRNSADSITFPNGSSLMPGAPGSAGPMTGPLGARISVTAGVLTVNAIMNNKSTIDQGGTPAAITMLAESLMKFSR